MHARERMPISAGSLLMTGPERDIPLPCPSKARGFLWGGEELEWCHRRKNMQKSTPFTVACVKKLLCTPEELLCLMQ